MTANIRHVDTEAGCQILAQLLDRQLNRLVELEPSLRGSEIARISAVHPIYSSIIEDGISIRILGENGRLNQAYIIARAFLERLINYSFLQLSPETEFSSFIDYSKNKAGRRLNRSIEVSGEEKARLEYAGGEYSLPSDIQSAIEKFTSEKGREKTRWTKLSLPERALFIEKEVDRHGLFMHLLCVYGDASEAIHGTLYGALFHFGIYDPGSVPHDQASLDRQRYSTLSMLYLVVSSSIDTLLLLLRKMGEDSSAALSVASDIDFNKAAKMTGLD